MVPLFFVADMKSALEFYTRVLDFTIGDEGATAETPVIGLTNNGTWLVLTTIAGDQKPSINVNVVVDHVDALFQKYIDRGLDVTSYSHSPVHQSPVNQTWGTREFYVTDPDGNTLRFVQY